MTDTHPRIPAASEQLTVRAADRELALLDLAYLNRMTTLGQVLPNVAHELNNALQVIGGLVEILTPKQELPDDVREKVTRIGIQANRASELVKDLVTFARRDDGGVTLVDVSRAIERVLAFRRYHLARARIAVTVEGARPGEAPARLDGSHLQQILLNLLTNAEHSVAGTPDAHIIVRVERMGPMIQVRVTDNGTGLPADQAERVTEPFFTTKSSAAGLGLTVAAGLARLLGGELDLHGDPFRGAVATLRVPALDDSREGRP